MQGFVLKNILLLATLGISVLAHAALVRATPRAAVGRLLLLARASGALETLKNRQ